MSDNLYPLALYRDGSEFEWDGRGTDRLVVDDEAAHETAQSDGWRAAADYLATDASAPSILDGNAVQIAEAIPGLSLEQLEQLKADETAGKTRKGVLSLIEAAIDERLKD